MSDNLNTDPQVERGAKDYRTDLKPIWCAGCGDYGVVNAVVKAFMKLQIDPEKTVMVGGIGCSSRLPLFVATYGFHGVHGRTLPIATGVKVARPELTVVAVSGDGDGYSIGAGHLPHACRRNANITYIVMDNAIYGLTKGQTSPTSARNFLTKSTPEGALENPVEPLSLALVMGATFVARGFSSRPNELADMIAEGIDHKGFSWIDVFSPCPTFNRVNTFDFYKERVQPLPDDHDRTDKLHALSLADVEDPYYLGVFYKVDKPTFEEGIDERVKEHTAQGVTLDKLLTRYA
jgi:2-oxoglutarate ferredoxin oxidoreductase subunit beta